MAGDYLSFYYHGHVELAGFGGYDNRSHADPVTVVAGLTTPGIDEVLLAPGHVTGTVKDGSGVGLSHVEVHAWVKLDGSWWEQWWTISEAGGTYDLGNLPTAVYRVQFVDPGGAYPTLWYGGADAVDAAADVVVTAGQTTTGIHSTLGEEPPPSDTTPPTTSASGADALWHRSAVSVTFSATDEPGGSGMSGGVAKTQYKVDGGSWTSGTRCVVAAPSNHSRDGRHTVTYRSTDAAGNTEAAKGVTVKIDTLGPVTAARAASGRRARAIELRYRVTDRLSPGATAIRIVVKNRRNVTVKTLRPTAKNTGVWYAMRWTPKATGTYRYYVHAKDLAGNAQSSVGSAKVVVR